LALALGATVTLGQSPAQADAICSCFQLVENNFPPDYFTVVNPPQLAMAVPEPSTWAMLLVGFTALAYTAIRKARTKSKSAP
jgi:hypothetical protein